MKIIITSMGRAHLLDSARELQKLGHDVTFLCSTHHNTFKKYGLNKGGINLIYYVFPFYFLYRKFTCSFTRELYRASLDWVAYFILLWNKKCDVYITQSPNYCHTMKMMKKHFGAISILDRGSSHVDYFNKMKLIYDGTLQPASYIKMDKAQYYNADYILVGSNYVKNSFIDNGFPSERIIVNNYGMRLDYFRPTKLDSKEIYDLIMVGNWSKRKGCDVLIEVCKKYNYSLLHIGAISDVEFPNEINFKHHNTVPESELVNYYSKAKVFVLLSKDEGLALVQPQAVACGLPLVITKHTGGDDLLQYIDNKNYIKVVDNFNDIDEIGINIQNALDIANSQIGTRKYCNIENKLSWKAYGERLNKILFSIVK